MATNKNSPVHGLNNENFKYQIKDFRRVFVFLKQKPAGDTITLCSTYIHFSDIVEIKCSMLKCNKWVIGVLSLFSLSS